MSKKNYFITQKSIPPRQRDEVAVAPQQFGRSSNSELFGYSPSRHDRAKYKSLVTRAPGGDAAPPFSPLNRLAVSAEPSPKQRSSLSRGTASADSPATVHAGLPVIRDNRAS